MMHTSCIVKGTHTNRTGLFIRSCVAYTYVTIPSIMNPVQRLRLYVLSGCVAINNQALSQADAFFHSAINFVQDVPPERLVSARGRPSVSRGSRQHLSLFCHVCSGLCFGLADQVL